MVNHPSVKTISERLGLDTPTAKQVRALIQGVTCPHITMTLLALSDTIGGYGVEIARSNQDTQHKFMGLSYVNMGETYANTIIFDHSKLRWIVTSWGQMVETDKGKRF